jgi:alpha-tubulin suppressor-like RCC1 family protein
VVLDNGQVHCFGHGALLFGDHCHKEQSGSYTIKGHKIQSIASGYHHGIMVTMRGVVFGFGRNSNHQLGVVDPSALSDDTILTPIEVFAPVTKLKGVARLPDGSVPT